MRGPVSPDAVLAARPGSNGGAAMFFEEGKLSPSVVERAQAGDPQIQWIGRSLIGQLGIDIRAAGVPEQIIAPLPGTLLPIEFEAYTPVGEATVADMQELVDATPSAEPVRINGDYIDIGRAVDLSQLVKLDAIQTESAKESYRVCFESELEAGNEPVQHTINQDGSVTVQIEPCSFEFDPDELLGEPEDPEPAATRLALFPQGRSAAAFLTYPKHHDPEDPIPDFLLSGLKFSPGDLYWRIKPQVSQHVFQIASANLFDGNRLAGTGSHLPPYDRLRQVELVFQGGEGVPRPKFKDIAVTIDLYRSKVIGESSTPSTNWNRMTPEARRRRHILGVTALEALDTADEASREALLDVVREKENTALVLSRRGGQIVKDAGNYEHNTRRICRRLQRRPDGLPDELEHITPLADSLKQAGDRTATVIADKLRISDLESIKASGARAILSEHFMSRKSAVTDAELSVLIELTKNGVGLAQANEIFGYREFHPMGLWLKPGVVERLPDVDLSAAIFGANRSRIGEELDPGIGMLLDGMIEDVGDPHKLAVVHGGGNGVMWSACRNARERGILSFATGIHKEGQINMAADGIINMLTLYYLARQQQLDAYHTVTVVILPAGYGSMTELYTALTSRKLHIRLPAPVVVCGPKNMLEEHERIITGISRQDGSPESGRHWIRNIVHYSTDFEDTRYQIKAYHDDPAGYWGRAGIPSQHVAKAARIRQAMLAEVGITPPLSERRAVQKYCGAGVYDN